MSCALTLLGTAGSAWGYERYEKAVVSGGTVVTVYRGVVGDNSETYLTDESKDYVSFSRFVTASSVSSTSNITTDTCFEEKTAGTPEGCGHFSNGGVPGVSWDNDTNTLTLEDVQGTVLTIAGPTVDVRNLNTPNDKLDTNVDIDMESLGYFFQRDVFEMKDGTSPHEKEDEALQDVVYVCLVGESSLHNIRLSGNVKLIFTGSGTLTLDASEPLGDYYGYRQESGAAISSVETIGHLGRLSNRGEEEGVSSVMELPIMTRTITEWYGFTLPEVELSEGLMFEGGEVQTASPVEAAYYLYTGKEDPFMEGTPCDAPEGELSRGLLFVHGEALPLCFDGAGEHFYVTVMEGMGPDAREVFVDISALVESYEPFSTFVGEGKVPAAKVTVKPAE